MFKRERGEKLRRLLGGGMNVKRNCIYLPHLPDSNLEPNIFKEEKGAPYHPNLVGKGCLTERPARRTNVWDLKFWTTHVVTHV